MNEKYSDPFEDIMLEVTFCRYPMRHGAEVVDGVGEVAAEGAAELVAELVAELAAVLSPGIASERVVELAAALAAEGAFVLAVVRTFVLVLQL